MKLKMSLLFLVAGLFLGSVYAQPRRGQGNATPEERAKAQTEMMAERLKLNDQQKDAVYKVVLKYSQPLAGQENASQEERRAAFMKRREEMQKELNTILTDEQKKTYEALQEEMRSRQRSR